MQVPEFRYMRWARKHSGAHRFDLTISAAPPVPLSPVVHPEVPRQMPTGDGDLVLEPALEIAGAALDRFRAGC